MQKPDGSDMSARNNCSAEAENPWTCLSRSTAYENNWIKVYHDEVIRPDGQAGVYGVVHYKSRSVGVVALDKQGCTLLVGQFRYTLSRYSWEIPAGGTSEGEDPLVTARRELEEETGFSAGEMQFLLRAHLSNSITDEEAFCYVARDLVAGQPCPEGTEQIRMRWVPFGEALRMVSTGEITDALTILGLQQVAILEPGVAF